MKEKMIRSIFILPFLLFAACSQNDDVKVNCSNDPVQLKLATKTDPTDCLRADGEIAVSISGGRSEYELTFENQKTTARNFKNLESDTYKFIATDKFGCKDSLTVTLQGSQSKNLTWSNQLKPIFITYCVKSGCHSGSGRGDFNHYSDVKEYLNGIKRRVAVGSMPPDQKLSKENVRLIVCWIDSGAQEK